MRHIQGESRHQATLLPERLEDYVPADHPTRVIDAFIDRLDVAELGFTLAITRHTGRKPYHPADLLKLYVYGYLNQVRSSRRLERECQRNLEVMWLMKRLAPDFKTIANFRKQNPQAIKAACRAFIQFCRHANLLTGAQIAIDGSKFKSAASLDQAMTRKQLNHQRQRVDSKIDRYLQQLAEADRQASDVELDRDKVNQALESLQQRRQALDDVEQIMNDSGRDQYCATECEARIMRSGREGKLCGYNVQSAVDTETGLIVHHQVTDEATDNRQLQPMAEAAKSELKRERLEVIADAGYSNGEQLDACEKQGIEATVPSNRAINNQGDVYQKSDFSYDKENDWFVCPAGERLTYQTRSTKRKQHLYARTGCSDCPLQPKCTRADKRWVSRHFYEGAFAASEARLQANPDSMKQRMAVVERPFAQLKQTMGLRRFLCWSMETAGSEMAIGVLSYNLRRMMGQIGVKRLLAVL